MRLIDYGAGIRRARSIIMNVFSFKSFLSLSLVMAFASVGFAAGKSNLAKPSKLDGAEYCQDQEKLKTLTPIVHLDERNGVDRIVIQKSTKQLHLLSQGRIYKTYNVAFGFGFLEGNKIKISDGRTPEGLYHVELKNSQSAYHRALRVSYPNADDVAFAKANGVNPGSDIMIHGFPSGKDKDYARWTLSETHPKFDWTQGCIAVTDKEIEEIFSLVAVNTAIEICPR